MIGKNVRTGKLTERSQNAKTRSRNSHGKCSFQFIITSSRDKLGQKAALMEFIYHDMAYLFGYVIGVPRSCMTVYPYNQYTNLKPLQENSRRMLHNYAKSDTTWPQQGVTIPSHTETCEESQSYGTYSNVQGQLDHDSQHLSKRRHIRLPIHMRLQRSRTIQYPHAYSR